MAEDTALHSTRPVSPPPANKAPRAEGRPEDYFNAPTLEAGVFEIGIVLGGTVSVGSYTAGVLDFLIQALDEWGKARAAEKGLPAQERKVPQHQVRLRIFTGTSGGGICSLLAARALHFNFPPAVDGAKRRQLAANPFYDVWVNDIDMKKLLRCSDLKGTPPPPILAALNGQVLQTIATNALAYPSACQKRVGRVSAALARPYLTNPLPVIVTHSNVAGIPYRQAFNAAAVNAEYFTNHADYVRIYFDYPGPPTLPLAGLIPDALTVYAPASPAGQGPIQAMATGVPAGTLVDAGTLWPNLAQYALGTSAFPIGLPARTVARDATHYAYRFAWDTFQGRYDWLIPVWSKFAPAQGPAAFRFTSLDGGCTDNEPIELARQTLEGLGFAQGPSPARPHAAGNAPSSVPPYQPPHATTAAGANRAILLVDPLCEIPPDANENSRLALLGLLGPTAHMFVQANRFATSDIADFLHPNVYNRFLVAPKRTDPKNPANSKVGGDALCGDGLGAFLGFMHKDFRHHDFMLGRYNCQAFLAGTFALDATNPAFSGPRPTIPAQYVGPTPPANEAPVIPLLGTAADPIQEPRWPRQGTFKPGRLQGRVTRRAKLLLGSAATTLPLNRIEKILLPIAQCWLAGKVSRKFVDAVRDEAKRKGL